MAYEARALGALMGWGPVGRDFVGSFWPWFTAEKVTEQGMDSAVRHQRLGRQESHWTPPRAW